MKMGKKKSRATQTSKGERRNVSRKILKAVRRERRADDVGRLITLTEAWKSEKNPWLTVPNPNTKETNKKFVRIRSNDYWGRPNRFVKWKESTSE